MKSQIKNAFRVSGVATDRPLSHVGKHEYKGPKISASDIEDFKAEMLGKPVYYNHDYSKPPIGLVSGFMDGMNGEILTVLDVDRDAPGAAEVIQGVKNRSLKGLSIGTVSKPDKETLETKHILLTEISICPQGATQGTHIISYRDGKNMTIHGEAIKDIVTNYTPHTNKSTKMENPQDAASSELVASQAANPFSDEAARKIAMLEKAVQDRDKVLQEREATIVNLRKADIDETLKVVTETLAGDETVTPERFDQLRTEFEKNIISGNTCSLELVCSMGKKTAALQQNLESFHQKYLRLVEEREKEKEESKSRILREKPATREERTQPVTQNAAFSFEDYAKSAMDRAKNDFLRLRGMHQQQAAAPATMVASKSAPAIEEEEEVRPAKRQRYEFNLDEIDAKGKGMTANVTTG